MNELLLKHFDLLAQAPDGVKRLRELILTLAVQGKLGEKASETGWRTFKLGDLGNWGSGGTPAKSFHEYYEGGTIPWLVIGDLTDGVVSQAATQITELGLKNSAAKMIPPGTILIAMYGSIGKLGISGISCATNQAIAHCRPNKNLISFWYFFYALQAIRPALLKRGQGLAQQNISQKILHSIEIAIPPIREQDRIVARIEELMRLCDALEAKAQLDATQHAQLLQTLLATLTDSASPEELAENWQRVAAHFDLLLDRPEAVDALEQTILQLAVRGLLVPQDPSDEPASVLLERIRAEKNKLVNEGKIKRAKPLRPTAATEGPFPLPCGWAWAHFPMLGEFGRGKSKHRPRNDSILFYPPKYPLIQTGEVSRARGIVKEVHSYYSDVGLAQSQLWPKGTLCITIAANIAESAVLGFDSCFPDSVVGFIPASAVGNVEYFLLFVETAKADLLSFAPATAQKNINLEILESLLIPLPPQGELTRIVTRVKKLRQLCGDLRAKLAANRSTQTQLAGALASELD